MKIKTFEKARHLVCELDSLEGCIERLSGMDTSTTQATFTDPKMITEHGRTFYFDPATEEDHGQLEERRVIIEQAIEGLIKSYKVEQAKLMAELEAL